MECKIAHRRSVALLCMLFKIKTNPIHSLSRALLLPYKPARFTLMFCTRVQHSFAPPLCRTSRYYRTFVLFSVFLWNDIGYPVFDGVGLVGFKSRANTFPLS